MPQARWSRSSQRGRWAPGRGRVIPSLGEPRHKFSDLESSGPLCAGRRLYRYGFAALNLGLERSGDESGRSAEAEGGARPPMPSPGRVRDVDPLLWLRAAGQRGGATAGGDIDSEQMIIRIVQSKGRKDRHVMLPAEILDLLRQWWKARPTRHDTGVAPETTLVVSRPRRSSANDHTPVRPTVQASRESFRTPASPYVTTRPRQRPASETLHLSGRSGAPPWTRCFASTIIIPK